MGDYDLLPLTFAAVALLAEEKLDARERRLAQLLFGNLQFPGPAFVAPVFAVYLLQKLFTPAGGSTVPAAASLPSTGYTSQLEPFDLGLALRAATMNRARGINASSAIDIRHLRIAWACLGAFSKNRRAMSLRQGPSYGIAPHRPSSSHPLNASYGAIDLVAGRARFVCDVVTS